MSTAKFKCGGCKKYYLQSESINSGITRFCSVDCMYDKRAKKPSAPAIKKANDHKIPDSVRKAVLIRDGARCRYCSIDTNLHLHHIVYRSQGGKHTEDNLITLCSKHHELMHSNKRKYLNLCQGVIWMNYLGHKLTIPNFETWLKGQEILDD